MGYAAQTRTGAHRANPIFPTLIPRDATLPWRTLRATKAARCAELPTDRVSGRSSSRPRALSLRSQDGGQPHCRSVHAGLLCRSPWPMWGGHQVLVGWKVAPYQSDEHTRLVRQPSPLVSLASSQGVPVCPTILAFSGGREREQSDRRVRPTATPGWTAPCRPRTPSHKGSNPRPSR
jgi:hypothetical protein